MTISQAARQLADKSENGRPEQSGSETVRSEGASPDGRSSGTDNESKIKELQSKLQEMQSRLAADMRIGSETEAGAIQGQIMAVMTEMAALQGVGV